MFALLGNWAPICLPPYVFRQPGIPHVFENLNFAILTWNFLITFFFLVIFKRKVQQHQQLSD